MARSEVKMANEFSVKGLLQEAITRLSEQELGLGYCYERLEFLGDAVLDLLITWHLFQSYTDLHSASVNNEHFAQVGIRRNLQQHLLHSSGLLLRQITEYVKIISETNHLTRLLPSIKGAKVGGYYGHHYDFLIWDIGTQLIIYVQLCLYQDLFESCDSIWFKEKTI